MGFRGVVFEKSNLTKAKLTQVNIEGTRFDDCVIHKTVVDVPALITYGLSKGFILEVEG